MNTKIEKKRKIGILGGTFDPVHRVHLELAKKARMQYDLTEVWLMPSGDPPHKSGRSITPGWQRLELLKLALTGAKGLVASDYELRRSGKIYTAETLERLSAEIPDVEWYLIMGGDSLLYLDEWYHPEKIFRYAVILAAVRKEADSLSEQFSFAILEQKRQQLLYRFPEAKISFLQTTADDLSSSLLRALLTKSERSVQEEAFLKKSLPECVYSYLLEHDLYKQG